METGHIGLNVSDIDRSKKFYLQALGFDVIGESQQEGRRFAFLGKDQKVILTLWQQSQGRVENQHPGLHHLSFQVGTLREVQEAEKRLQALKVHFHYDGIVPHKEGATSGGIFFEDPDGIRLEIFTPEDVRQPHAPVPDAPTCGFF
jgi:lactoylglutathione lyase